MFAELLSAVGGLGLFLLGMMVMTEGLKGLAGQSLRRLLTRFTRTPVSGAATGAVVTALIQSSSATTVTAVGFVGAGLLTFAQALGIIFGANIGTTMTGWLVALIGFKLDLGMMVLPLVLVGALMRLFASGRARHLGWALAGFSLLFVGIDGMQDGLASLEGVVTPEDFPDDTFWGRCRLLLIGVAVTIVTQSSSAGIAAALVALGAGAISFPQAGAMIIGMDVGTTFTAALASLGGGTATRRTGFAHVIYNVLTGIMAFLLLDPYVQLVSPWVDSGQHGDPQLALVTFHTSFNLLGVLLVLPFTQAFARLIIWIVPEKGSALLYRLDDRLLSDADAATDAAAQTLGEMASLSFSILSKLMEPQDLDPDVSDDLEDLKEALETTRGYTERIRTDPLIEASHFRHREALHTLDHLTQLSGRLGEREPIEMLRKEHDFRRFAALLRAGLPTDEVTVADAEPQLAKLHRILKRRRHTFREQAIEKASSSETSGQVVLAKLDAFRWLFRVSYHSWRITFHLRHAAEAVVDVRANPRPGARITSKGSPQP